MKRIHIHIDRLVLDGLPLERSQGNALHGAVVNELTRLIAVEGIAAESSPLAQSPTIQATDRPGAMGVRIAGAVHNALRRDAGGRNGG